MEGHFLIVIWRRKIGSRLNFSCIVNPCIISCLLPRQLLSDMDSLAKYSSSDESSEESERLAVPKPHLSTKIQLNQVPTSSSPIPAIDQVGSLIPYLANYNMNKKSLLSGFVLLPWKPKVADINRLQSSTQRAINAISEKCPELKTRYDWHFTGANKPVVFGRYGYTNVGAVNSLHISLFPNFYGEKHRFTQLQSNMKRAVRNIALPGGLIKEQESSAIDKMLLLASTKKCISLRANPSLRCYMSSKSGTVFVALDIYDKANGKGLLPEYQFLRQMTQFVEEQVGVLDCKYDWRTMVTTPSRKLDDGLPVIKYHVTLLIGEIQFYDRRLKPKEFQRLKEVVQLCNVSDVLGDITVDIECLRVRNIAGQSIDINLI